MTGSVILFRRQNWFLYVLNNGNFYNKLSGKPSDYPGWNPTLDMAAIQVNTVMHGTLKENLVVVCSLVAVRV